jgi:hypothetical protein
MHLRTALAQLRQRISALLRPNEFSIDPDWGSIGAILDRTLNTKIDLANYDRVAISTHCQAIVFAWMAIYGTKRIPLVWLEEAIFNRDAFRQLGRSLEEFKGAKLPNGMNLGDYFMNAGSMLSARTDLHPVFRSWLEALRPQAPLQT